MPKIENVQILGCFNSDLDPSGKGVILSVEHANGERSELHFGLNAEQTATILGVLGVVQDILKDEIPPRQGEYVQLPR
jgi:hypothetical protein